MASVLSIDKKIAAIGGLAEGSSIPPAISPVTAVRAFIVQEFRNAQPA